MDNEFNNQIKQDGTKNSFFEEKKCKLSSKSYKISSITPTILFAIYAVLMLVFLALLPVVKIKAFDLNENYGSILTGAKFEEIPKLNFLSVVVLLFSVIIFIVSIILLLNRLSSLKYNKFFGKPLYKFLEIISILLVLVNGILSVRIIDLIKRADEGLKIIRVASYPILTIVVSIICLLAVVVAVIFNKSYEKQHPEILQQWVEERENIKAEARNKKSASAKATSYAKKRLTKFLLFPIPLLIIIFVTGVINVNGIVDRFKVDNFNASELKQIVVEDSGNFEVGKSTIELKLGESYVPLGGSADKYSAVYYSDNYIEFLGKVEKNQKYSILAIEQGDYRISNLLKQAKNLELEQETLVYGQAQITYNDSGCIKEVVYNNVVVNGFTSIAKKLDEVKIYDVSEIYANQGQTERKIEKIAYLATYKDGSFIYGTCDNVSVVLQDGTVGKVYEGSYVGKTIKWQDEFGEYEVVAPSIAK